MTSHLNYRPNFIGPSGEDIAEMQAEIDAERQAQWATFVATNPASDLADEF